MKSDFELARIEMAELRNSPGWGRLLRHVEQVQADLVQELITAGIDQRRADHVRGVIEGIRRVIEHPRSYTFTSAEPIG